MVRSRGGWLVALGLWTVGCGADERVAPAPVPVEPPRCDAPDLDDPTRLALCETGGGSFGRWTVDALGLPAYDYELDQHADARAAWFDTEGLARRDHWSALGNHRVNALFSNEGYVEVVTQDRGPSYLNKYDEETGAFAGGFSYLDDGEETWCSAYRWRPPGATATRRFGVGYAEATTEHRELRLSRRTSALAGDAPLVVDEVTLQNLGATTRTVRHYEVWDVARRPIETDWLASGDPFTAVPATLRGARDARNALFVEQVAWDADAATLGLRRAPAPDAAPFPTPEAPSAIEHYPGDPFLAVLLGQADDTFTEQDAFFGAGGVAAPAAVASRSAGEGLASGPRGAARGGLGQPRMLGVRSDVTLAPGASVTLRYAYGYAPMGAPFTVPAAAADATHDVVRDQAAAVRPHLLHFATEEAPVLHRELAWHAAQLQASVGWRDYWQTRVVPQGSAYLYLHGADGAARDLSLFAVPLTWIDPALARDELALNMRITHAEGRRISYAFQGHGVLDDALGLHAAPSDLTLFLLWGLTEYLGATGDLAFLDAPMPYHPPQAVPGATTWDHLRDAVRHLFDTVGVGAHGLVRVQTGDWSDGIVVEAPDREEAVAHGESVPNTQMAATILPRVADLVEARDAALAEEIRGRVAAYRAALAVAWTGSFYGRAYFGDDVLVHAHAPNLEAQVWALIGDLFDDDAQRAQLVARVRSDLDEPSPFGATLLPDGQVWPAIGGLLTWGYARHDRALGFAHLQRMTMAAHAEAYPDVWYGIWSGPDGLLGPGGDRPGEAWYSSVTPMTDFPVMNANQHAMPLLAALRVAGVEATATGIRIEPRVPSERFALRTRLVDVDQSPRSIRGSYRPLGGGTRTVEVVAPPGQRVVAAWFAGAEVTGLADDARRVAVAVPVEEPGEDVFFRVETAP